MNPAAPLTPADRVAALLATIRWPRDFREAARWQRDLARKVIREDRFEKLERIAGVDVAFPAPDRGRAAVVVCSYPDLLTLETALGEAGDLLPYRPGFLAFREIPAILEAYRRLSVEPDLLIVDGHGLAHPRRLGIASHLGVLLDRPTIGCAKSLLTGRHGPLGEEVGAQSDIIDDHEVVGRAVRTRRGSQPVYVSIGHRVSLETAVQIVLRCCRGYRLPEPTRRAHLAVSGRR